MIQSLQLPLEHPVPPAAGRGRLQGKVALVAGDDDSVRALATALAREGADVATLSAGDTDDEDFCRTAVARTLEQFGRIDILVNDSDIQRCFHMTKFALPHMRAGASIIHAAPSGDGAVACFTRSVSRALSEKGIRVDAVAPDGGAVLNS